MIGGRSLRVQARRLDSVQESGGHLQSGNVIGGKLEADEKVED